MVRTSASGCWIDLITEGLRMTHIGKILRELRIMLDVQNLSHSEFTRGILCTKDGG